jgi:hypothetical protein
MDLELQVAKDVQEGVALEPTARPVADQKAQAENAGQLQEERGRFPL